MSQNGPNIFDELASLANESLAKNATRLERENAALAARVRDLEARSLDLERALAAAISDAAGIEELLSGEPSSVDVIYAAADAGTLAARAQDALARVRPSTLNRRPGASS